MTPEEIWAWIEKQEKKYMETDVPVSDRQVEFLIRQLKGIENQLPEQELYKDFALKMEAKFIRMGVESRFMLFDFIKNLIHTIFIKKEHYTPYPLRQP